MLIILVIMVSGCLRMHELKSKVIVGLDESPLGYVDESGRIVGFEVELARSAIKRAGIMPEFKIIAWADKERALDSGEIDLIWNGLDITPER